MHADPAKSKPLAFVANDDWVFALAVTKEGKTLLTGGSDGKLIAWPATADAPKPIRTVTAHHGWVRAIAVSPDGTQVATCGNDHKVRLWSLADDKAQMDLPGHARPVYRVAYTADGKFLVSADLLGLIIQWDVRTGKEARRLDASKLHLYEGGQGVDHGGIRDLSFSRDWSFLACSGLINASNPLGTVSNPVVLVLDWKTGAMKTLQHPKEDIKGVAWGRCDAQDSRSSRRDGLRSIPPSCPRSIPPGTPSGTSQLSREAVRRLPEHRCPNSAHVLIPSQFSRRELVGSRVLSAGDCPPDMFDEGRRFCKTRPAAAPRPRRVSGSQGQCGSRPSCIARRHKPPL